MRLESHSIEVAAGRQVHTRHASRTQPLQTAGSLVGTKNLLEKGIFPGHSIGHGLVTHVQHVHFLHGHVQQICCSQSLDEQACCHH